MQGGQGTGLVYEQVDLRALDLGLLAVHAHTRLHPTVHHQPDHVVHILQVRALPQRVVDAQRHLGLHTQSIVGVYPCVLVRAGWSTKPLSPGWVGLCIVCWVELWPCVITHFAYKALHDSEYMQSVLIMECFICKASSVCSAL